MFHWLRWPAVVFLVLFFWSALCRAEAFDSLYTAYGEGIAPFSLMDQRGKTVTLDDLRGKYWVASFFFTCCSGNCPTTQAGMARLQKAFAGDPDVALVSFSVYPEHDTPEKLAQYAKDHGAKPNQWFFLTGEEESIYRIIRESFGQGVQRVKGAEPGKEVNHTFRLVLVGPEGNILGYVDGTEPREVERLEIRLRFLVSSRRFFPALNASLNGCCAVLLVLGYLAIRRRREALHKVSMLSALAVSAVFLASYLYYHLAVMKGQPTRFQGESWLRPVYLGILLSHTVLAVAVAPLALVTAYLGLRDRRKGHVRLARWTLPLWLYVSVTGVVVYWMLYRPF